MVEFFSDNGISQVINCCCMQQKQHPTARPLRGPIGWMQAGPGAARRPALGHTTDRLGTRELGRFGPPATQGRGKGIPHCCCGAWTASVRDAEKSAAPKRCRKSVTPAQAIADTVTLCRVERADPFTDQEPTSGKSGNTTVTWRSWAQGPFATPGEWGPLSLFPTSPPPL